MKQDDFTEVVHAYLELLDMVERAREALSGEIIPDNPDNLKRYMAAEKGIDTRPYENHARKQESLRAIGLRPSEKTETLARVMELYHRFSHAQLDCTQEQEQVFSPFLELMAKVERAQEIIADTLAIPGYNERNREALKVLGLKSDKEVKKAATEFQNFLFFIQYLELIGVHPPNVAPSTSTKSYLTKTEAVNHLKKCYQKTPQAIIKQLKRGRKAMIDRSNQAEWLIGVLPPDWPHV